MSQLTVTLKFSYSIIRGPIMAYGTLLSGCSPIGARSTWLTVQIRRVLPPTATSRVFFPSAEDLIQCFSATALPAGKKTTSS